MSRYGTGSGICLLRGCGLLNGKDESPSVNLAAKMPECDLQSPQYNCVLRARVRGNTSVHTHLLINAPEDSWELSLVVCGFGFMEDCGKTWSPPRSSSVQWSLEGIFF
ncbi:hypothetical protein H920_08539 [Fukomys damarensis]|uniref:Uncharacterized protein n=1 Tax=Fukomys damarensis TaxID=885580 RepID=A0A091DD06_FUKDA|nr:hypothetical protein H920_08539 [Fukomys damarensis]